MELIKNKIKNFCLYLIISVLGVMLIEFRDDLSLSISNALTMCADVLIPSILPFMILSAFVLVTGIFEKQNKITAFVMNKIFRLPVCAVTAVIFGLIGGYPVGARIIAGLYENGSINSSDARHLFAFCINAGPAFIISFAGKAVIGSEKAGHIIFAAVILSSLIVGFLYSRLKDVRNYDKLQTVANKIDYSSALVSSVTDSSSGIISVCTWVVAFSAFSGLVSHFITDDAMLGVYNSVAEVTSGLIPALKTGGVAFSAACIAFGGLSVACQVLPAIKKCGVKASEYLFFRIINSVLVYFITSFIMKITEISVFTGLQYEAQLHFAPASAALMIMCAVLIFDLASHDEKKLNIFG